MAEMSSFGIRCLLCSTSCFGEGQPSGRRRVALPAPSKIPHAVGALQTHFSIVGVLLQMCGTLADKCLVAVKIQLYRDPEVYDPKLISIQAERYSVSRGSVQS